MSPLASNAMFRAGRPQCECGTTLPRRSAASRPSARWRRGALQSPARHRRRKPRLERRAAWRRSSSPSGRRRRQPLQEDAWDAEVHAARRTVRLLDEERDGRQAARPERATSPEERRRRSRITPPAFVSMRPPRDCGGSGICDPAREDAVLVRSRIPGRPPHYLEADPWGGCLECRRLKCSVSGISVVEHEDARSPTIAREQGGERGALEVVGREDTHVVAHAGRVQRGGQGGSTPAPCRVRPTKELNGETIASGPSGARFSSGRAVTAQAEWRSHDADHVRVLGVRASVGRALRLVVEPGGRNRVVAGLVRDPVRPRPETSLSKDERNGMRHLHRADAIASCSGRSDVTRKSARRCVSAAARTRSARRSPRRSRRTSRTQRGRGSP